MLEYRKKFEEVRIIKKYFERTTLAANREESKFS